MKTIKLFFAAAGLLCLVQACSDEPIVKENSNTTDTVNIGCLASYELLPGEKIDTVNKLYGKEKIKHGRWVDYELSVQAEKSNTLKTTRVITGMGHYKKNKKEGLWRFFKPDGSLKDSVVYKNDSAVEKFSSSGYFKHLIFTYPPTCSPLKKCS